MGYCYDSITGALCCDACGKAGQRIIHYSGSVVGHSTVVRKRKCPYGYCSSAALCRECFNKDKSSGEWSKYHEGHCKKAHLEYKAQRELESSLLASGRWVRKSALMADVSLRNPDLKGMVHVLFVNSDHKTLGRIMTDKAYHSHSLGRVTTLEDYEALEGLVEAPSDFYGNTTKGLNLEM